MKLALNDPVWDRLYGPYGVEPVAEILAELDTQWNAETANNLFWEMLHHQETLYPVTYAALPWLFDMAKRTPDAAVDSGVFFAHVIYCAGFPSYDDQPARFRGLSTIPSKHHHSWIDPSQRLRDDDAKMLCDLELWFDQNKKKMADFAVGLSKSAKPEDVGYLLKGYAALAGALLLVHTLEAAAGAEAWVLCPACEREFLAVWKQDAPEFEMYTGPGARLILRGFKLNGKLHGNLLIWFALSSQKSRVFLICIAHGSVVRVRINRPLVNKGVLRL